MYNREDIVVEGMDHTINERAIMTLQEFKVLETSKRENRHLRRPAMQNLVNSLVTAYELPIRIVLLDGGADVPSFDDAVPTYNIELSGRLSIISLLNAFFRIVQVVLDEPVEFLPRQRSAVLLFKSVYPEQFARLIFHPETGGFSLPGRELGFKARVRRPDGTAASDLYTSPPEVERALHDLGIPVPPPMSAPPVTTASELRRARAARNASRVADETTPPAPESCSDEEEFDERDTRYYDEESPER
jgi:hypothetical protein